MNKVGAKRIERGAWSMEHGAWSQTTDNRISDFGFRKAWSTKSEPQSSRAKELQSHRTTEVGGQRSKSNV